MINPREGDMSGASVSMSDASFPSPHKSWLEYGTPARGVWNIVHTGMLIPESHQIFVCAQGCLRGVVLTAAEMNASDRFSTIAVCENNVLEGDMEALIIDGTEDILNKLPKMPKAVLIFTSCIHKFMACDLDFVYSKLREKFPGVDFTDCYMTPIMRKTWISPDSKMRSQLYSLLKPAAKDKKIVNIIGNNYPTYESSDFISMLRGENYTIRDICGCKSYSEYQKMAQASTNIVYTPAARPAAEALKERLGQDYIYIPLSYGSGEIVDSLKLMAETFSLRLSDIENMKAKAEESMAETASLHKDTPVAIDYTATSRPLGLARLLLSYGIKVRSVYADVFIQEEKEDFDWLKKNHGTLKLYATLHPKMGMISRTEALEEGGIMLAIGQKAAYFTGTSHFVNILEGGGLYGFDGICKISEMIRDAYLNEKDTKAIIQVKGWGCCS